MDCDTLAGIIVLSTSDKGREFHVLCKHRRFIPDHSLHYQLRIAFPVYAFMLAEGFLFVRNDRNRLVKHLSFVLILAFLAEPALGRRSCDSSAAPQFL